MDNLWITLYKMWITCRIDQTGLSVIHIIEQIFAVAAGLIRVLPVFIVVLTILHFWCKCKIPKNSTLYHVNTGILYNAKASDQAGVGETTYLI